jgi:hypothetical protein
MRFFLALLAVLTLAASPITAAAAQAACGRAAPAAMQGMTMPGMDSAGAQATDPCCNHGDQKGQNGKGCAQTCATACALAVALPASSPSITRGAERATVIPAQLTLAPVHEPSGPERPPKSMA